MTFRSCSLLALATAFALTACGGARTGAPETGVSIEAPIHRFDAEDRLGLAGAPVRGPTDALVTVVVWSDFECPFCARVVPTLEELQRRWPDDVRVVFKHHPLPFHTRAGLAHQAAEAAHAQGRFWEYHDAVFGRPRDLDRETLEAHAEAIGLDLPRFRAALDTGEAQGRVDRDLADARAIGVQGTPNFLVNGTRIIGAQPIEVFDAAVRDELARAQAERAEGLGIPEILAAAFDRAENDPTRQPSTHQRPAEPDPDAEMWVPIGDSPVRGPADALVTIVVISEFQCPFCARAQPTLSAIEENWPGDIRIVFKHLPLDFHAHADSAARASWAAHQQGRFWEYHDLLFANQEALEDADLARYAEALGLDLDRFRADWASDAAREQVAEDKALAGRLAARGTPHFFVNGYRLRGAQPFEAFAPLIEARIAEAQAEVEAGTSRSEVYEALQSDAIRGDAPVRPR